MRIANVGGRLVLMGPDGALDVERVSAGHFAADPHAVYGRWDEFIDWVASAPVGPLTAVDEDLLGSPSPRPGQVFAIGLNYSEHAAESGFEEPDADPPVFTKFRRASPVRGATSAFRPAATQTGRSSWSWSSAVRPIR